ncbi:hypothetical protein H7169_01760 [Candidatus Gracilibacteria bacterium]|nr:hypothetical protein [Candidatus Gracilibacteria bacterium]
MSQYNIKHLEARDIELYEDICISNGMIPCMSHLTKRQIELLISIRGNIVSYTEIGTRKRLWKVLGKTKQGGHLTQAFSRTFFLGEK